MPNRVLALDVSGSQLTAVVVESSFRSRSFLAHAIEPRDPARPLAEQLRDFVARHRLAGDTVLSALPARAATYRMLDLPFRDRRKLLQTVPFELENQVPVALEDAIVDFQVVSRESEGARVFAAMAPRRRIEEHLRTLAEAGLDPAILDFAPLTTLNALLLFETDRTRPLAFLHVDGAEGTLGVWRNGELCAIRALEAGDASGATLSEEVLWSLRTFRNAAAEPLIESTSGLPLVISGLVPSDLPGLLRQSGGLEVRRLEELRSPDLPSTLRDRAGAFAPALGLAVRELDDGALGVNFRREEFAYHRREQEWRAAVGRLAILAAVVAGLFVVSEIVSYAALSRRYDRVRRRVEEIFKATVPNTPVGNEAGKLREAIAELEKQRDQIGGPTALIEALRELALRAPLDPRMNVEELTFDGPTMLLRAKTPSFEAVETIKKALLESQIFRDVQVKDPRTTPDGSVEFRLTITLGSASAA